MTEIGYYRMPTSQSRKHNKKTTATTPTATNNEGVIKEVPVNDLTSAWKEEPQNMNKSIDVDRHTGKVTEMKPTVKAANIDAGGPGEADPWAPVYANEAIMDESEEAYAPSKFERIAQSLQEALREQHTLDPSGEQRTVAVIVTTTQGKTWDIIADSTDDGRFKDWEIWSKIAVDLQLTKMAEDLKKKLRQELTQSAPHSPPAKTDKNA